MEDTLLKEQAAPQTAPAAKPRKPKIARGKKRPVRWLVAAAVLGLGLWAGTKLLGGETAAAASRYTLAEAVRRDIAVTVSGSATLEPADSYRVTALVSGEILEAPFEELSTVQAGDLLYTIDAERVQDAINTASLGVRQQELAYRQAVEAKTPVAPISGTVTEVYVREGDTVNAGDKLLKIVSSIDVTADFLFPNVDASEFAPGQKADVFIQGYEGSTPGSVVSVSDGSALTADGKRACSVRVKIANPGAITGGDSHTAQAVIGSYASYGRSSLNMSGSATVRAAAGGTVSGFDKLLGSAVTAGEILCGISSQELDDRVEAARLAMQSAQLQVSSAQGSMDGYRITSPISGTVIQKDFKAGDKVDGASSGALAEIYDLSCLKMNMAVNELDIGKVAVGQKVELTAAALPGEVFSGRVDKVGIAGTTSNGFTTYPVTVVVEEYGALRPGMNVSATISCDTVRDALCVPVDAVARGSTVLVPGEGALSEDGAAVLDEARLERRPVSLGRGDESYIQITQGLEEGETVAYLAPQAAEG